MSKPQDPEAAETVQTTSVPAVDLPRLVLGSSECRGPTHYVGCACHEKGWENKWKCAIEMAARAEMERDMWKANHDNQVAIKRIIAARPDMKERAPMVEKLMAERNRAQGWSTLQHERIKRLEAVIRKLDAAHEILPENEIGQAIRTGSATPPTLKPQ